MKYDMPLLIHCYRDIEKILKLSLSEWDLLIRQGRRAGLLGRFFAKIEQAGLLDKIPDKPANHLFSSRVEADRIANAARWEVGQIAFALKNLQIPIVALKGAAYALTGSTAANGRLFNDVDILVPKPSLADVESQLKIHGWLSTHMNEYDQQYYRKWMHEIPPMHHIRRKTNLDIHHAILPETATKRPDSKQLLKHAIELEELAGVYILSPVDMWLHSATHLFQEGEFHNALRDLTDLDILTREMTRLENFWQQLVERAQTLNLSRQLYYGLRYSHQILDTPVPSNVLIATEAFGPRQPLKCFMDSLFQRAFLPLHKSCDPASGSITRWVLYLRSHAIRMPAHLLLPHLAHKMFTSPYQQWKKDKKLASRSLTSKTTPKF